MTMSPRLQTLYDEVAKPAVFAHSDAKPTPAAQAPTAVLVAGQPGAGRNMHLRALANEYSGKGGIALIDPEALLQRHPDAFSSAAAARRDTGKLVQQAIGDAARLRLNVAITTRLDSPTQNIEAMRSLQNAGYRVELRALAVPTQDSTRTLLARGEGLRAVGLHTPQPSKADHDRAYQALPKAVAMVEASASADRVTVLRADQQPVYDNHRVADRWQSPPIGGQALVLERDRERTTPELQARCASWAAIKDSVGAGRAGELGVDRQLAQAQAAMIERMRRAPAPHPARAAMSWHAAENIARHFGGAQAVVEQPRLGRATSGLIVGETSDHVLQATQKAHHFVGHLKSDLATIPALADNVDIRYGRYDTEQASVTRLPERERDATRDTPERDR